VTSPADGGKPGGGSQTILVVACIALSALVVALAWQNRGLKADLAEAARAATQHEMPADAVKDGDRLEPLDLLAAGSRAPLKLVFDGTGGRTLLMVFSSTCPACRETLPIWNEIASELHGDVRVVAIQSDLAIAGPVAAARFPIYGFEGARPKTMDRIPFVPFTAIVAPDGSVSNVAFGMLSAEQGEKLKAALGA